MRRSLLALLIPAALLGLAGSAGAQPSPAPRGDCAAFEEAANKAYKVQIAISDELAVIGRVLAMEARPDQVYGATQAQLSVMLAGTDGAIKQARKIRDDETKGYEERAKERQRVMLLEKWYSVLLEFQTTRSMGQAIDPQDNGYVRWREKAARRQPKLKAALPGAEQATRDAVSALDRCKAGHRTPTTTVSAGERVYLTTLGDVKLTIREGIVTGTYAVQAGPRFANGVDPTGGAAIVGRIDGQLSDNVIEGYWHQPGGAPRCPSARNGYPSWGKFRWMLQASGGWIGKRGVCDGEPATEWNGQPKN